MENHKDYLRNSRRDYSKDAMNELDLIPNPLTLFDYWFNEAVDKHIVDANAMSVATVDGEGKPHIRIVLLRQYDEQGFVFYTNYESAKSQHITHNTHVCLHFFWKEFSRQIKILGTIQKTDAQTSDDYFLSRPRENQLSALVSPQSKVIPNRTYLENKYKELDKIFENKPVERPQNWGGYCVKPNSYEFWQGRTNRLHDRFIYTLETDNNWKIERLAP